MIDYSIFTQRWVKRASDPNRKLDKGDRFISLWIAFNGWMKRKYGETKPDRYLIDQVKSNIELMNTFLELKNGALSTFLEKLGEYTVTNMRYENIQNESKHYDGTFESLIEVLYQIRCNLFHGRKNIDENRIDEELVHFAFDILHPIFEEYLRKYDFNYL